MEQLCQRLRPASKGSCPHAASVESYSVYFEPLPAKNFLGKTITFAKELCSRFSPSSIKSAWYIGTHNDLSQPFIHAWKRGSYVSEFVTPKATVYLTADPTVMRAIFANPRKTSTGLFHDYENQKIVVSGILKDLYPDEIQAIGIEKAADLLVMSAEAPHVAMLRAPMMKVLGHNVISAYSTTLSDIADGILKELTEEEKKCCDAFHISFEYVVTVISKLFIGYNTSRTNYQKLANTLDAFSKRMGRIVSHRRAPVEEEKEYRAALTEMKAVIEKCLSSPSAYLQSLKEAGWNDLQIKFNLFFLYWAGTETTTSAMNYLIWQLGREENRSLQQKIRDPQNGQQILLKTVAEALRMHPPVSFVGRQLREDVMMTIKDKNRQVLWKKELRKGHSIVCLPQTAGLDSIHYPEPERFNPYRFQEEDPRIAALSFLPFGSGPHMCPGQNLALAELQTFAYRLLTHFSICTLFPETMDQKGFAVLRATSAKVHLKE
jgi:cytochrome P450